MKIKATKISAVITTALLLMLCLVAVISSLPTLQYANAYNSSEGYVGNEDATDLDDFDDSISAMYRYRAWSVFKSMGMNDNQAIAALACMQAESGGFRSERIEGTDPMGLGVSLGDTWASTVNYVAEYSQKMDTDPDFRTQCTDKVLLGYNIPQSSIDNAHNGTRRSVYSSTLRTSLDLAMYYHDSGVGYLGIGMYQWTGYANQSKLFEWSDKTGSRWFEFDNQLAFCIADPAIGGYKGDILQAWIESTKDCSLDECVETYFHQMINGNDLPEFVSDRQTLANDLYPILAGKDWDDNYAADVLAMAELEPITLNSGIQDRGIIYSYASSVVLYPRNGGMIINAAENDNIYDRNVEVFTGYVSKLQGSSDTSTTYSLFELYGEDLHWYRYFGEATYQPNLMDHVWSAIDQDKVDDLISFSTIDYDATNYLSCNVYPDRPMVLSSADLDNGDKDPRVSALSVGWFNGFFYVSGSAKMAFAKWLVALVAFLTGPEIREVLVDIIEWIESTTIWAGIRPVIFLLLGFAMVGFIISLVGKAIRYAKGNGSMREAVGRFLVGFAMLGLLFAATYNPSVFNQTIDKVVNVVDNIFNATLAESLQNDEVIAVQDPSLATHAVLWKKAIFNPWCRGQFDNLEYNELYTHYASLSTGQSVMPQSHEVIDPDDMTGKAFYDSASLTGDVFVPRGGGVEVRNWAAYLMSCGTPYHIDSTLNEETATNIDLTGTIQFPNFTTNTTANNPEIPADLFRIIDAQMDISPQYFANGSQNLNYQAAHGLKPHYEAQSIVMLFNASMLAFLIPVIFQKIMAFALLMMTTFKLIYFSILEIFKEGNGFKPFFDSLKKSFVDYFTACLKLNVLIVLYYVLIDRGFIELVLYIACCLMVLSFKWEKAKSAVRHVSRSIQRFKKKM
ncbi:MAG: hypothetical protein IJZ79_02650 [Bacilli bacterium]|nr:hypothetical protein [Bacilli bacterium]MBQ8218624.1 hypothetical protein [Bacilli bacterium]